MSFFYFLIFIGLSFSYEQSINKKRYPFPYLPKRFFCNAATGCNMRGPRELSNFDVNSDRFTNSEVSILRKLLLQMRDAGPLSHILYKCGDGFLCK
ncbi:hypothetical protein SNEBB_005821 [Seison nebaliae]|nr:hypothetical protein SNEBB_005821 [Seison nebaliae]